ncbi:MAG: glutamine-hydrolyzing carbamoyl-phosphate synthase small subunit [Planctomycetota bacterium]|nr:glutamine-hydrolyzing carbamoyl-phosphate synthase small subunit [Planctomycetota bacterium]
MKTGHTIDSPVVVEPRVAPAAQRGGLQLRPAAVVLEDGTQLKGLAFGHPESVAGETVFNTGMVGYPESLTDPSYFGQLLVCTYPLVGNYGVPDDASSGNMPKHFESDRIHARGLIVSDYSAAYSHWNASRSLDEWLREQRVPAITGIDTRTLTKILREKGSMLGKIVVEGRDVDWYDPNHEPLGPKVSVAAPTLYKPAGAVRGRVAVIDCGCKHNIVRSLLSRGLEVVRLPWDHDLSGEKVDAVMLSNGPGDPTYFDATIRTVRSLVDRGVRTMGVCLGNQLLALAIGARTYKLKYGHRGQNQPALEVGTNRAYMTSQNHGFAVDEASLPAGWSSWFINLNDRTNEGIRHTSGLFRSVQFHPEACPGPVDTAYLFDDFAASIKS